jgi:hypothetical protein
MPPSGEPSWPSATAPAESTSSNRPVRSRTIRISLTESSGNPTKSYRSRDPLRVTGEVEEWTPHTPEELKVMHDHLERLRQLGIEAIED